jgi:hypothetical protein
MVLPARAALKSVARTVPRREDYTGVSKSYEACALFKRAPLFFRPL